MPERSEGRGAWGPDALPAVRCGGGDEKNPLLVHERVGDFNLGHGLAEEKAETARPLRGSGNQPRTFIIAQMFENVKGEIPAPPKGAGI